MMQPFALFFNGNTLQIESGHIHAQWRIHQSAQTSAITDWSKYPHTRYLLPSKQHVQPFEALVLALKHTNLAPILFDQGQ